MSSHSKAQELTLASPQRVNNLILYSTGCGGKDETPTSPEIISMISNSSDSTQQRIEKLIPFLFPNEGFNANPD